MKVGEKRKIKCGREGNETGDGWRKRKRKQGV